MEPRDWKSRKTLVPLVLSLAVLTAACARRNPGLSSEYRAKARQAFAEIQRVERILELNGQEGTPLDGPEIIRATEEAQHAFQDATQVRETAGDYRVHKQLASYMTALLAEELFMLKEELSRASGERSKLNQERWSMLNAEQKKQAETAAARAAALAAATTAARKEVETSLR